MLKFLPYILHTLYFNFKYLPFQQALKLPILLYKPKLISLKGIVKIESPTIATGMIKLGVNRVSIYKNNGISWENKGGVCVFKGKCTIGNSSFVSLGKKGKLIFGNEFSATAAFKVVSYNQIEFGNEVQIGWENIFIDTDFHTLTNLASGLPKKAVSPIKIGSNNWFGLKSVVLKGVQTPDFCTIGAYSLLNKKYLISPYTLIAGNPASLKSTGVYWDRQNDKISEE